MKNMFAVVVVFIGLFIVIISNVSVTKERIYDCGMAEWHPDIPNAVKEECRRRYYEERKKENATKYRT